jgi:hypothetical protein
MARCRECNAKVWRNAQYCQNCKGFPLLDEPRRGGGFLSGVGRLIGAVFIIIVIIAAFRGGSSGTGGSTATASPCKSDWTRCIDNSDLVNNYLEDHSAQNDCKSEAVKRARYGDPKFPWLYYFDTFYKGDQYPKTGIAILIEKDAQYQNGFGAMVHSEVTCTYDLRAKRVLNIEISPR